MGCLALSFVVAAMICLRVQAYLLPLVNRIYHLHAKTLGSHSHGHLSFPSAPGQGPAGGSGS